MSRLTIIGFTIFTVFRRSIANESNDIYLRSPGEAVVITIAEVVVDLAPATIHMRGSLSAWNNNWIGGKTELSVETDISIESASAGINLTSTIVTETLECEQKDGFPSAEITVQLDWPDELLSLLSTLRNADPTGLVGLSEAVPSNAILEGNYQLAYVPVNLDGDIEISVRTFSSGLLKRVLMMSGSDVTIGIKGRDISLMQAGILVPISATITLMDPDLFEIPIEKACGIGSKPCDANDRSTDVSIYAPLGLACKAFCDGLRKLINEPILYQELDLAAQVPSSVACGDNKCFAVGDTSGLCEEVVPQNCTGSWSECNVNCNQSYLVLKPAKFNGEECIANEGTTRACTDGNCVAEPLIVPGDTNTTNSNLGNSSYSLLDTGLLQILIVTTSLLTHFFW